MSDDDDDENKQYDVTRERIREIEEKALKMLSASEKEKEQLAITCSFCGKSHNIVKNLIQSDTGATICNECVALCNNLLNDKDED